MKFNLKSLASVAIAAALIAAPSVAFAVDSADPFSGAAKGAETFRQSLTQFALAVGGIGLVSCLLLGFFGKLNWKWVATGGGVSFALAIVPQAINWLNSLAT